MERCLIRTIDNNGIYYIVDTEKYKILQRIKYAKDNNELVKVFTKENKECCLNPHRILVVEAL